MTRREWLSRALAGATLGMLNGCCSCPTPAALSDADPPFPPFPDTPAGSAIDAHCHVFNGRDVPGGEFVTRALLHLDDQQVGERQLADLTALMARFVSAGAPSYAEEMAMLELAESTPISVPGLERLEAELRTVLGQLIPGRADEHLELVRLLAKPRYRIAERLIATHAGIDVFTPALVDLELWVVSGDTFDGIGYEPPTAQAHQIALLDRISRLARLNGRIHGFAAYCPWRAGVFDAARPRSMLDPAAIQDGKAEVGGRADRYIQTVLQPAIFDRGFVGVKIYPPLGFAPTGNAEGYATLPLPSLAHHRGLDRVAFGRGIDRALERLFLWCVRNEVPVMAHCSASNLAAPEYASLPGPSRWAALLGTTVEGVPLATLRVNLAHLGGETLPATPDPANRNHWAAQIGELIGQRPHVYADVADFDGAVDDCQSKCWFGNYLAHVRRWPAFRERLMYGSDYTLLVRTGADERFATRFRAHYARYLGEHAARAFMGVNARRFIGATQLARINASREARGLARIDPAP